MMLFWAGLRGAVGVALATGIKGPNATALRTTVLVTVVLTMIVFGGTTTRMIEIVGIRTGVDEGDDSSDEDEPAYEIGGRRGSDALRGSSWNQKYPMRNADNYSESNDSPIALGNSQTIGVDMPYSDRSRNNSVGRPFTQQPASSKIVRNMSSQSLVSTDSYDDQEALPPAGAADAEGADGIMGMVWRDGQWFNVLDERYLLPVFSNATASRKASSQSAQEE